MSKAVSPLSTHQQDLQKVKLYFCPIKQLSLSAAEVELVRGWLPEDEINKVERYIQLSARDKGLMVRGYLRGILSKVANSVREESHGNISPSEWRFEYGKKGKPCLVDEQKLATGLTFNISHSGDWLIIAVATHDTASMELGVDIERYRQGTNIYPILNNYFTSQESQELLALSEPQQRDRFFDLWALKESYIKAKGLGLALSLKSFSFDLSPVVSCEHTLSLAGGAQGKLAGLSGIKLSLHQDDRVITATDWQVAFGRLDSEYRFAVSLNTSEPLMLDMVELDISSLLEQ